jgi:hypothetical protein
MVKAMAIEMKPHHGLPPHWTEEEYELTLSYTAPMLDLYEIPSIH